ncbi:acyl homoserine lactone synthase [Roseivivax lentus]|uniref:Acyl-homoserine-lactone synthase n=1 Tax=Roseivivax lentus TaxID=633194 RepID=A0A1N7Q725_9RHOB|nr:acyl homoserine lactone synthase [Roseivivax lentus]
MIRIVLGTDLWMFPSTAQEMFTDRSAQFSRRLKWSVYVDANGFERDQYDSMNPIYIWIEGDSGDHLGSMRLLPTTGPTMINDHFLSALNGEKICNPSTWECTRFCISPKASPRTAFKLLASAARLMEELNIEFLVAVFDQKMLRKYNMSGVRPRLLGSSLTAQGLVLAGQWSFDRGQLNKLIEKARLDPLEFDLAMANSSLSNRPGRLVPHVVAQDGALTGDLGQGDCLRYQERRL